MRQYRAVYHCSARLLHHCFFFSHMIYLQFKVFQIPLTFSLLGCILVAADQYKVFSGVLSLILSRPCGLTCDRFHITQPQRSLGDPIPFGVRNALIS